MERRRIRLQVTITQQAGFGDLLNHYDVMASFSLTSASLYTPLSRDIQNNLFSLVRENGSFQIANVKEVVFYFDEIDIFLRANFPYFMTWLADLLKPAQSFIRAQLTPDVDK